MQKVKRGSQGAIVSRLGLGCVGMSEFYGERDDRESAATILRAPGSGHQPEVVGDRYVPAGMRTIDR